MNARCLSLVIVSLCIGSTVAQVAESSGQSVELFAEDLEDRIRGGLLGQLLGNLNRLRHEMKYIDKPGNVNETRN